MMKKLFLLLAVGAIGVQASAQYLVSPNRNNVHKQPIVENTNLVMPSSLHGSSANKGTSVGNARWYNHFDVINALSGGALDANLRAIPIWFDSTVRQRFISGLEPVNYLSVSQIIDPIRSDLFNDANTYPDAIRVSTTTPYRIDSISIAAVYQRMATRPVGIVDTLIISVVNSTLTYQLPLADFSWIPNYTANDTLFMRSPTSVDSVNRSAFGEGATPARFTQKIPLTAAMGDTGGIITRFVFPVNGSAGLNIPAGNLVGITATFKSGDNWQRNVDTINMFHRFMPLSAPLAENQNMEYDFEEYNDRSMSSLMFSTDTSFYSPSIFIEGTNTSAFAYEYHAIGAFISCATCAPLSVKNTGTINNLSDAYPNPANTQVSFNYSLKEAVAVTATITNTVGQVIMTQQLPKATSGKATFDVSGLSTGLYFYTIEANGQRQTNRVVIAH